VHGFAKIEARFYPILIRYETLESSKKSSPRLPRRTMTMAMYVHAVISRLFFVCLLGSILLGSKGRALAEGACLEQPGPGASQGEHWFYHFDRGKSRKCWHLGTVAAVAHELPAPRTERTRTVGSALNSVFGPLVRELRNWFRQPMPHEVVAGEPRIVQSDATRPLTIEDIAQPQPDLPEERAETRPAASLTPAQKQALFEAYLKWEEQRNPSGGR